MHRREGPAKSPPRGPDHHPRMARFGPLEVLLASLAPDQRAATTAPPGPVLVVAPAGSGKTTTLVARVAWRLAHGEAPARLCAVTFNRRAAADLRMRLGPLLAERGLQPDAVRVRTFHALGREILLDAGRYPRRVVDRLSVLRTLTAGRVPPAALRHLDEAIARSRLEPGAPAPPAGLGLAYQAALEAMGAMDHDDLVAGAVAALADDGSLRDRWRARCGVLLVDEVQDLDQAQWRLARLLTTPADDLFLVGDDDQTIYAWRLADARRMLRLAAELPHLRRVDLHTNYRCPAAVVERAVDLVAHNQERLAKQVRAGGPAAGTLTLVADPGDDVARARALLGRWAPALRSATHAGRTSHAVLARTRAELAAYAALALELGIPYWAEDDGLSFDRQDPESLNGWAVRLASPGGRPDLLHAREAVAAAEAVHAVVRRRDARLLLATVHAAKGLEFDVVACVGLDQGRFPSVRAVGEAVDPARQLEEERRLAYVAWTRARSVLELVYDPGAPSPFIREAFRGQELRAAAVTGSLEVRPRSR